MVTTPNKVPIQVLFTGLGLLKGFTDMLRYDTEVPSLGQTASCETLKALQVGQAIVIAIVVIGIVIIEYREYSNSNCSHITQFRRALLHPSGLSGVWILRVRADECSPKL